MRVFLSSWFGYSQKTGVGFYVDQLIRHLNQLAPEVDAIAVRPPLDALATRAIESARGLRLSGGSRRSAVTPIVRSVWNTARDHCFRWFCLRNEVDLYHEPNYIPMVYDGPVVTTVHDMSVLLHPEWHPLDRVRYFEKYFCSRLTLSTRFIADSEFTRMEMLRHLPLGSEQIDVVPLAARPNFRPMAADQVRVVARRLGLPKQYLLFVGTLEPRKNLIGLVRAYSTLPPSIRTKYPLLLVGRWGWGGKELSEELKRNEGTVHFKGYIPEKDMAAVYNGATALVYPSLYEGFGLPPLEMMASGRPVIVSNRASLPEVVGTAGIVIEPEDNDAIADAILELLQHPELADQLGRQGQQRALSFSWRKTALQTLKVYHRALGSDSSLTRAA